MRIVHVTDAYLPKVGGIEMQVSELAARQQAQGHEVLVVTRASGGAEGPVPVVRGGRGRPPWHWLPWLVAGSIRAVAGAIPPDADVVHCHLSVFSPAGLLGLRTATSRGIPVVATYHSVLPQTSLGSLALRPLVVNKDRIAWTAVSRVAAESVSRVVGPRHPVDLMPNGLDLPHWQTGPDRRPDADELTAVWVGRLARRKRPLAALQVVADAQAALVQGGSCVRLRLLMVGDGPMQSSVRARADELGLGDQVELLGSCNRDGVRAALARADLFLGTALAESFGIAAMEARAAGLPVVVHSCTGTAELVVDGVDGLLADDDAGLAAHLQRVATDHDELARLRGAACAAPPPVDWARSLQATERAYARAGRIMALRQVEQPPVVRRRALPALLGVLRLLLPTLLAVGLIGWALPRAVGTDWPGISAAFGRVQPLWVPAILAVWLAGLWVQTVVQRAFLPQLTTRQAFLLNATGSAVSNIAPAGGALGIAANQRMVRHWGVGAQDYAAYAVLTNLVQLLQKFTLPVVVLVGAALGGAILSPLPALAALGGGGLLLVSLLATTRTAALGDRALVAALSAVGRGHRASGRPLSSLRARCEGRVRAGWLQALVGTGLYTVAHAAGLWLALHAVGVQVGLVGVLGALAVERAASLMLLTPAGAGVAEVAAAALLVRMGVPAPMAVAGLLLHRLVIVGLEVPLGALLGTVWWLRVRQSTPVPGAGLVQESVDGGRAVPDSPAALELTADRPTPVPA